MNYYWLLEALNHQHNIKTVMIDTSLVYNTDEDVAADYMKNLQNMRWTTSGSSAMRTLIA